MITAKTIEYRIIHDLLAERAREASPSRYRFADKVVLAAGVGAVALVMGSLSRELLLGLMAASTILVLGLGKR